MSDEKLNGRINFEVAELEERISYRINRELPNYNLVVSPRDLTQIRKTCVMHQELLSALIRNVPLRNSAVFPYKESKLRLAVVSPKIFDIGQTFVLKDKIFSLMAQMPQKIFDGFCLEGISSAPPLEIYGKDGEGRDAIALYVPPIIEYQKTQPVLLDGIHRSYLCKGAGTQVNAVHILGVETRLPFDPISWNECSPSLEKPPKNERYRNPRTDLFRDLTYVGIDG